MNKKAFTIIELLIVVIIIGVLSTIAIPQFNKAVERTKFDKAKHHLALVLRAANECKDDERGGDGDYDDSSCTIDNLKSKYSLEDFSVRDKDWDIDISSSSADTIAMTADRKSGRYSSCVITLTNTGEYSKSGTCVK